MAKCEKCNKKIEQTFLQKPLGTIVKDAKGKKHMFCSNCQRGKSKEELLAAK